MKHTKVFIFFFFVLALSQALISQSDNTLWYDKPATYFEESLVLGNGKIGASVFGGVTTDKIYLNDATLWSGEPVNPSMNPIAHRHIPAIREALSNENYKLADSLQRNIQGSFSQSFAPLGTLFLNFKHKGTPENYYRELSLENAVSLVRYQIDGVTYTREYLISHPDNIMMIKLSSSKKGGLNFTLHLESQLKTKAITNGGNLNVSGYAPYHTEPSYRGDIPNPVLFDEKRGTRFSSKFKISGKDGKVNKTPNSLEFTNGTEALIYVSIATSFNGFEKNPATEGLDDAALAIETLGKASKKSFQEIKENHLKDYQSFFNRVQLNLGETTAPNLPTDERLRRYAEGQEDKNLEVLYFQFGRYLMISSSRTKGVPANLQGIWNPYIRPPWSSNYTININLQENYWLAETGNLSEMHAPLLTFIDNIAKTGEITAKTFFGVDEGWAACHNSDIWAMSNPVGDFGQGDPVWANWYFGGTWLSTHLWEHYLFTQDSSFLKEKAYPLMKGAAQFALGWLVSDKNGKLVTSPSTSPENQFITPDGYKGSTLYGSTTDLAIIRENLAQTIEAARILNIDSDFRKELHDALSRLYPYQIGKAGHLQEWYHDWEDVDPKHRHQSHLFGLFPGSHITPDRNPELANASKKTLEIKGDETTGWSKGWRINLWARLWDGNRAYKMYRELLHYVEPDGLKLNYSNSGGTYPNLFDAHPPFQIDGNFGGAASVIEMLIQSTINEIHILPALPEVWETGYISGVRARGGFEVDMEWKDNKLTKLTISSEKGGKTVLKYGEQQKEILLAKGEKMDVVW